MSRSKAASHTSALGGFVYNVELSPGGTAAPAILFLVVGLNFGVFDFPFHLFFFFFWVYVNYFHK